MLERGRLPAAGELGLPAVNSKSVSSLLSRKPRPGTTIPLTPVCSMVNVATTTLPFLSAVTRFVVLGPSCDRRLPAALPSGQLPLNGFGSPAATGRAAALVPMSERRVSAKAGESRPQTGTGVNAG